MKGAFSLPWLKKNKVNIKTRVIIKGVIKNFFLDIKKEIISLSIIKIYYLYTIIYITTNLKVQNRYFLILGITLN